MKQTNRIIPKFNYHERFLKKINVDKESGCWNWTASLMAGYGCFVIENSSYRAHRVSYSIFNGDISDEKMVIDHICRNRKCVNPDHLREVLPRVNIYENSSRTSGGFINSRKTHCRLGHPFDDKNTLYIKTGRRCRACDKIWQEKYRDKLRFNKKLKEFK